MPIARDPPPNLDGIVERFEARARAGRAPAIERVLAEAADELDPVNRERLLIELVAIDLEYRWQSPHRRGPLLELYVKRLGEWATLDATPLELVAEEYRARHRFGDCPAHAEYAARFPRHGRPLLDELRRIDAELAKEYPEMPTSAARPTTFAAAHGPPHTIADAAAPLDYRDYAIRRLIAAGGMSRVYTAVQKSLLQPVALKVLNKHLALHSQSVRRFVREARIAAALDLPGVVNAFGLGRFPDGGYFMVLRLIDGADLSRMPNGAPLPDDRALEFARRIAALVLQLHERGWLHCDLKPSNILVDSRGQPWLTDFAMAQPWRVGEIAAGDEDRFALGGTPAFMAPEQFAGDAALLSPATDVFALGGVFAHLLTGQPPRHKDERWLDGIAPRCAAIVRRCLAEYPAQRYPSCRELLDALTGAMTNADAAR